VVGHDHRFGRRGEGDPALLARLLEPGARVEVVPEFTHLDAPVRSTRVREHLLLGHVRLAAELLGRCYSVRGPVVPGTGTGRTLGFPTLNVHVPEREKLVPADGVYAALARLDPDGDGPAARPVPAAVNIGHRPTFGGERRTVEAHVIGSLDRAPAAVELCFVDRIRSELHFDSKQALAGRIAEDVRAALDLLKARLAVESTLPGRGDPVRGERSNLDTCTTSLV
jgi:riboflavin kinase/FMN adenylyltransferase